jgi:pilus assembly protein CpaC
MTRSRRTSFAWVRTSLLALAGVSLAPLVLAGQSAPPQTLTTQGSPSQTQATPPQTPAAQIPPAATPAQQPPQEHLIMTAGRSMVLTTKFDITRLAITDPTIADATAVSARELLIDGKLPGTISLIVWGDGQRVQYDLEVDPGITTLQQRLRALFPGEDIDVSVTNGALILSGHASSNSVMLRAAEIAEASTPDHKIINMLQLPGGAGSQQVLLQVRFAEVNRTALQQLGVSFFSTRAGFTSRSATEQFPAPNFSNNGDVGNLTFSDFLNIFFFQQNKGVGALVKALSQNGNLQSLAEPNLIAYNGQEASFLAGGEFPVPVVSGNGTVNVQFKEFGVKLKFKPTIAGDVIHLHLRPEVSTLDFDNGVTLSGFRIPALTERYAETDVELRDGQSFAIAGLLNTIVQDQKDSIPFLSRIPIIGNLFKSKSNTSNRTELMVLITPRLVRALNPDEVPPLPTSIKDIKDIKAPDDGKKPGGGGGGRGGSGDVSSQLQGGGGLVDAPMPIHVADGAGQDAITKNVAGVSGDLPKGKDTWGANGFLWTTVGPSWSMWPWPFWR